MDLARQVGLIVQAARARAGLTQRQLAARAGAGQAWVCRVERGQVDVRLRDVERLCAALGVRLIPQLTAAGAQHEPDPDLAPDGDPAAALEAAAGMFDAVLRRFEQVPHVLTGRFAALAQGLPVVPGWIDVVVAAGDAERVRGALERLALRRWSERWQEFRGFDIELDESRPLRWSVAGLCELRLRVVDDLPAAVCAQAGERSLTVLPLGVLLREDDDVARLAVRLARP